MQSQNSSTESLSDRSTGSKMSQAEQLKQKIQEVKNLAGGQDLKTQVMKGGKSREKIEQLTALIGVENLKRHSEQHWKNRQAEEQFIREKVWPSSGGTNETTEAGDVEVDDMGHTILGDVMSVAIPEQVQQAVPPKAKSMLGPVLATAAISSGIPFAGIAGHLLTKTSAPVPAEPTPIVQPIDTDTDSTVSIGLGRLEDYAE